jgi:hypothetical protein
MRKLDLHRERDVHRGWLLCTVRRGGADRAALLVALVAVGGFAILGRRRRFS